VQWSLTLAARSGGGEKLYSQRHTRFFNQVVEHFIELFFCFNRARIPFYAYIQRTLVSALFIDVLFVPCGAADFMIAISAPAKRQDYGTISLADLGISGY